MNQAIYDHGENDGLEFDLSGFEPLADGIRRAIQSRAHLGGVQQQSTPEPETLKDP